ncbi:MAG: hypothetical protein JWM05_2230, partial [Acidimicrobiales bacterium]|nr:hypothetical protein [Acidimicrobiales bacterium]
RLRAVGARRRGTLELWVPGDRRPAVSGTGVAAVAARRVPGGWLVTASTCADAYALAVGGTGPAPARRCPPG